MGIAMANVSGFAGTGLTEKFGQLGRVYVGSKLAHSSQALFFAPERLIYLLFAKEFWETGITVELHLYS